MCVCVCVSCTYRCTLLNKAIRKAMREEQTIYTANCGKFVHGKGVCQRIQSEQAEHDSHGAANGHANGHVKTVAANGHANGYANGDVYMNGHAESPHTPNGVH